LSLCQHQVWLAPGQCACLVFGVAEQLSLLSTLTDSQHSASPALCYPAVICRTLSCTHTLLAAGESCLCSVDASGSINYQDDTCSVCNCAVCPPPVNQPVVVLPTPPSPSPSPAPKPSPAPFQPNFTTLTVQTGRTLPYLNGSSLFYNGTIDAGISTQYNDTWNSYQGSTQVSVSRPSPGSPTASRGSSGLRGSAAGGIVHASLSWCILFNWEPVDQQPFMHLHVLMLLWLMLPVLCQFWPHAGQWDALEYGISDVTGGYAQRVLLRFNDLHNMLPDTVNVTGARLALSFYNWDSKPGASLMVSGTVPKV